ETNPEPRQSPAHDRVQRLGDLCIRRRRSFRQNGRQTLVRKGLCRHIRCFLAFNLGTSSPFGFASSGNGNWLRWLLRSAAQHVGQRLYGQLNEKERLSDQIVASAQAGSSAGLKVA